MCRHMEHSVASMSGGVSANLQSYPVVKEDVDMVGEDAMPTANGVSLEAVGCDAVSEAISSHSTSL